MVKPYYKIKAQSETDVDILIYGVIGDSWFEESITAKNFVEDFKQLEAKYQRINVRINSPGGSIWDGLPIFNAINSSKKDTHTYIDGIAYSMGAIIALAGKTVHAAKNSMFLLHAPLSVAIGNARDFRTTADDLDKYANSLMQSVIDKTGLSEEEVNAKWFDYDDHLMTSQEALDNKLIDVIDDYKAKVDKKQATSDVKNLFRDTNSSNFLTKIKNSLIEAVNMFVEEEPQNTIINVTTEIIMKQFQKVNNVLGVTELAATEEGVYFNEQQLAAIEDKLAAFDALEAEKVTALQEKATALADLAAAKSTAETDITNAGELLNTIGETVKTAATLVEKVEAVKAVIASKPGTAPAGTLNTEDPKGEQNGVKWDIINNLPHNKEVD